MNRTVVLILACLLPLPAAASLSCGVSVNTRTSFSAPPVPVGTTALISQIINQLGSGQFTQVFVVAQQGSGDDSASVGIKVNLIRQLIAAGNIVINNQPLSSFLPNQPPIVVSVAAQRPFFNFSGSVNLTSISIGGAESYKTAEGTCTFSDSLLITSGTAQTLAQPVSIGGSGFAAESFGDPNVTRGLVEVSVDGSIGGAPAGGGGFAIESVSIIPEMGSVSSSAMPVVTLQPGANIVPVNITLQFRVVADAKCAGLFCSLTGASTAGLTLPDIDVRIGGPQGIQIGPFTDEFGGPLPTDVSIVSESSGIIYADPGGSVADLDQDGIADSADNCTGLENHAQRDSDGDGFGNACDQDIAPAQNDCTINFLDLNALAGAFFADPTSPNWNPDGDFDGSASINFIDLSIMADRFFGSPGPSGLQGNCN